MGFLLAGTLFIIPLLGFTGALGFEGVKVVGLYLLTSVALFVWGVKLAKLKKNFQLSKAWILPALFLLTLLISSLKSKEPVTSLIGEYPYFQGWLSYLFLIFLAVLIAKSKIRQEWIEFSLILSSLFVSLVALKEAFLVYVLHHSVNLYAGRVGSTFGQANFYSGFLLHCLPLVVKHLQRRWGKITFGLLMLGILISLSKLAISLLAGFCFYLIIRAYPKFRKWTLTCLVIVILFSQILSRERHSGIWYSEVVDPQTASWLQLHAPEKRIFIWQFAQRVILQKPLLGFGLDQVQVAFREYPAPLLPAVYRDVLKDLYITRTHNYLLDLLIFGGLVSLLAWSGVIWQFFKRKTAPEFKEMMILYLIWSFWQNQSIVHLMIFWVFVGLSIRLNETDH